MIEGKRFGRRLGLVLTGLIAIVIPLFLAPVSPAYANPSAGDCADLDVGFTCNVQDEQLEFTRVGSSDQSDGSTDYGTGAAVNDSFRYEAVFTSDSSDVVDAIVTVKSLTGLNSNGSPSANVDQNDTNLGNNSIAVFPSVNSSIEIEVEFVLDKDGDPSDEASVRMQNLAILVKDLDKDGRIEKAEFTGLTRYVLTNPTTLDDAVSGGTATFAGTANKGTSDKDAWVLAEFPTVSTVGLTAISDNPPDLGTKTGGVGFLFDSSDPWGVEATSPTTVTPPSYTVSFDLDGGTGTVPSSLSGNVDLDFPDGTGISKNGVSISRWVRGDSSVILGGQYTALEDATFVAEYEASVTAPGTTAATVGQAFSSGLPSTSGFTTNDLTFSVTGSLPAGLSLNTATGVISGTPTSFDPQTVTLTATHDLGGSATSGDYAITFSKGTQVISWSPSTSLSLGDSGLTLSATLTLGDGTLAYTVVDAGTTGCEVDGSTLTFSSTGSGANGCEVRPTATGTSNFNAKNDATTVTFDVARGTFALAAPASKVATSTSTFTDVCTSSCDVTGFAPADEILVVVSKSDGSELSGLVRLDDDTGLDDVTGYTPTPTGASGYDEIAFEGTQAEVNAALETLQYKSPTGGADETIGISASLAGAAYFAGTGHYYEVISGDNKNQADAITAAASKTFNGLNGYLATILTEEENRFIDGKILDRSVWIGGKYNGTVWQWITGPGDEQIDFWTGTNPGSAISGVYAEWEPGQPDGSDDCLSTNYDGSEDDDLLGNWDDLTCSATKKWVVEYGGNGGTVLKEASATFTVGLPAPASSGSDDDDDDDSPSTSPGTDPGPVVTPGVLRGTPRLPLPTPQSPRPQILTGPVTTPGGLPSTPEPSARPRARIGGVPAPTTTTRSNDGGVEVQTGGVRLGVLVRGQEPGGGVEDNPMTGDPEIKVPTGGSTTLRGGGLLPGTSVQVWLPGSDGRELGRVPVGPDGSFEGDVTFGSSQGETPLPIGRQLVQVTGFDAEGNQTVVDMPVNIAQGPPTPEPNRQVDALPDLSQGQSLGTSAGVPVEIFVTGVPNQRLVTVEGDGWNYAVETDETGVVENGDGQTSMTVRQSRTAEVNGSGLQPGTTASLWLFSEPTLLGTIQVSDDGTFSTEVFVDPQFVAPGEHTLQIQAVGTDGYIKAANLGVLVEEPLAATASDEAGSLLGWAIAGIAVVVAILVWFLLWGRRRSALSA